MSDSKTKKRINDQDLINFKNVIERFENTNFEDMDEEEIQKQVDNFSFEELMQIAYYQDSVINDIRKVILGS